MSSVNTIIDYATKACVFPAIALNVLLLFLAHRFSRNEIGSYRYLILLFATCQILLSSLHFCINPKVLVLPGIFSVVSDSPYDSKLLTIMHYTSALIPYVIIIFLSLYRYWVVRRPYRIGHFTSAQFVLQWTTVLFAVLFSLIAATLWLGLSVNSGTLGLVQSEFLHKFRKPMDNGYVIFDYRIRNAVHLPAVFLTIVFDSFALAFIVSILSLTLLTFNYVSIAFALSPFTKGIHTRLLATIGVQSLLTIIFITLPSLLNMTLPIFGCSFPLLADVTPLLNALAPSLDAFVIIILSKSYRRGFITLCSRNQRRDTIQSPFLVTVAKTSF